MNKKLNEENTRISISISRKLLAEIEKYAKQKDYQSRNKFIVDIIKEKLNKDKTMN